MPAKQISAKTDPTKQWKLDVTPVPENDILRLWAAAHRLVGDGRVGRWRPILRTYINPANFTKAPGVLVLEHAKWIFFVL